MVRRTELLHAPMLLACSGKLNCLRITNFLYDRCLPFLKDKMIRAKATAAIVAISRHLLMIYVRLVVEATRKIVLGSDEFAGNSDLLLVTLLADYCLISDMNDAVPVLKDLFSGIQSINASPTCHSVAQDYNSVLQEAENEGVALSSLAFPPREECLACKSPIIFKSPWKAKCAKGHSWGMLL
ncbi:hypothetical protein DFJ73DRAFT_270024 [Zopfochytrium polystomum]|nr:hypothetical protein DFJ73DRAFT_270024 [Zopfochytrium polystomum]